MKTLNIAAILPFKDIPGTIGRQQALTVLQERVVASIKQDIQNIVSSKLTDFDLDAVKQSLQQLHLAIQ